MERLIGRSAYLILEEQICLLLCYVSTTSPATSPSATPSSTISPSTTPPTQLLLLILLPLLIVLPLFCQFFLLLFLLLLLLLLLHLLLSILPHFFSSISLLLMFFATIPNLNHTNLNIAYCTHMLFSKSLSLTIDLIVFIVFYIKNPTYGRHRIS